MEPVTLEEAVLNSYAGFYGPRKLIYKDGKLYYQRADRPLLELTPMDNDLFAVQGLDWFRIQVVVENGEVKAIKGLYDNGRSDENKRDNPGDKQTTK